MPLSARYYPEKPPKETCNFGMDFSFIIPPGVAIESGTLTVWVNSANPVESSDWTIGAVVARGRALYAQLTGGLAGVDYQLRWTAVDSLGNVWPRTALVLCAETS